MPSVSQLAHIFRTHLNLTVINDDILVLDLFELL